MSVHELDLATLAASARAYLEWESELSGLGVPQLTPPVLRAATSPAAPEPAPPAPSVQHAPQATPRSPPSTLAAPPEVIERVVPGSPAAPRAEPARPPLHTGSRSSELPSGQAPAPASTEDAPRATLAALAGAPVGAPAGEPRVRLAQLEQEVQSCTRCELAKRRTRTVFARGNPASPLVFIGEGPGQEEDREGLPFVGPAGKLLDKMVAAMGHGRDDVYICNVVKCRPPGNRTPLPSEAGACAPFLIGQLEVVRPRVIVALGRCATENLGLVGGGGSWRGRWGKFRNIDVMPTYHPAFLLRSPEFKRPVWEDLQKVMARLKQP